MFHCTEVFPRFPEVKEIKSGLIPYIIRDNHGRIIYAYGKIRGNNIVKNQTVSKFIKQFRLKKTNFRKLFIPESVGGSYSSSDNLFPQLEYEDDSFTNGICLDWILLFENNLICFEYFFKYKNYSKIAAEYCIFIKKGNKITGNAQILIKEGSDELFEKVENIISRYTVMDTASECGKSIEKIKDEAEMIHKFNPLFSLPGYGIIMICGIFIALAFLNFML